MEILSSLFTIPPSKGRMEARWSSSPLNRCLAWFRPNMSKSNSKPKWLQMVGELGRGRGGGQKPGNENSRENQTTWLDKYLQSPIVLSPTQSLLSWVRIFLPCKQDFVLRKETASRRMESLSSLDKMEDSKGRIDARWSSSPFSRSLHTSRQYG